MVSQLKSERPVSRLTPQPWLLASETKSVIAALTSEGAEIRFVGGCVRDSILGQVKIKKNINISAKIQDIDIATPEFPRTVIRLLQEAGIKSFVSGSEYGTITASIKNIKFEISTLRQDIKADGRHASIVFTNNWIIDAGRRDFTFNALSMTPEGDIYDFYEGMNDLSQGLVRFIGDADKRINEDLLRLLRFFRFFGYYGSPPADTNAIVACKKNAKKLPNLSGERIWSEISKILLIPEPEEVTMLMSKTGIFNYILPEAKNFERMRLVSWLETSVNQIVIVEPDALRRLAALIETDAKGAEQLSKRWAFSNSDASRLISMTSPSLTIDPTMSANDFKKTLYKFGTGIIRDISLLAWADELLVTPNLPSDRMEGWENVLKKCDNWKDLKFPLNGHDVTVLGIEEGPHVGELLLSVEGWWEESGYTAGRKACLKQLKSLVKKKKNEFLSNSI